MYKMNCGKRRANVLKKIILNIKPHNLIAASLYTPKTDGKLNCCLRDRPRHDYLCNRRRDTTD
jgi:hypothetical protein